MASEVERESEVLWLAFRYVSGEIGGDEAEAFERRLDQDQAAREAVARAVELAGAVAALEPAPGAVLPMPVPSSLPPSRRRPVRAIIGVLGLAAAACLAWLVVTATSRGPAPKGEVADAKAKSRATVALAWSTLRQEGDGDRDEASALATSNEDLAAPPPPEAEDAADRGLPLWLLDAASLARGPDHAAPAAKEL